MKRLFVLFSIFFLFSSTFLAMEHYSEEEESVHSSWNGGLSGSVLLSGFGSAAGTMRSFDEALRLSYPLAPPAEVWFGEWNPEVWFGEWNRHQNDSARYLESYLESQKGYVELAANCNRDETLLIQAARYNCPEAVRMLVRRAGSHYINYKTGPHIGDTALHVAVILGYVDVVKALLEDAPSLIDVNATNGQGNTALQLAVAFGHNEIIPMLIRAGSEVDKRREGAAGETALQIAAKEGNIIALQSLLKTERVDVNRQDELGWSALHWAALYCPKEKIAEVVELLKSYKASMKLRGTVDGNTPLHDAVERGHVQGVKALLDAGAFCDQGNKYGETPLMLVRQKGNAEVIVLLEPLIQASIIG